MPASVQPECISGGPKRDGDGEGPKLTKICHAHTDLDNNEVYHPHKEDGSADETTYLSKEGVVLPADKVKKAEEAEAEASAEEETEETPATTPPATPKAKAKEKPAETPPTPPPATPKTEPEADGHDHDHDHGEGETPPEAAAS